MNWKEFLKENRNRIELVVTLLLLVVVLISLAKYLNFIQARAGVVLTDPILRLFNPTDFTLLIFPIIYVSLIIAIAEFIRKPKQLMFAIQLYIIMVLVRMAAMYLLPLEPPARFIILKDPFIEFFGTGQSLSKDLFFSGHTATIFILFLVSEKKIYKTIFLISTIMVAIAVLLQHNHYTIDVFAAVFFTYACYKLVLKLRLLLHL